MGGSFLLLIFTLLKRWATLFVSVELFKCSSWSSCPISSVIKRPLASGIDYSWFDMSSNAKSDCYVVPSSLAAVDYRLWLLFVCGISCFVASSLNLTLRGTPLILAALPCLNPVREVDFPCKLSVGLLTYEAIKRGPWPEFASILLSIFMSRYASGSSRGSLLT